MKAFLIAILLGPALIHATSVEQRTVDLQPSPEQERHASASNQEAQKAEKLRPNKHRSSTISRSNAAADQDKLSPKSRGRFFQKGSDPLSVSEPRQGTSTSDAIAPGQVNRMKASPERSIVRTPLRPGDFGQQLSSEKHRGLNPAIVGGSANLIPASRGAINGTGLRRKP
jgi:hypothetical protein